MPSAGVVPGSVLGWTLDVLAGARAPALRMRHAPFAVTPTAREAWLKHFRAGLDEAQLPAEQDAKFWGYVTYAAEFMLNAED